MNTASPSRVPLLGLLAALLLGGLALAASAPPPSPAESAAPPEQTSVLSPYPIDGYALTGIRRLARLQMIEQGTLSGALPPPGGRRSYTEIRLHLVDADTIAAVPAPTPDLQAAVTSLFRGRSASYGLAMADITPGAPIRAATHRATGRYQPGSVGKVAVATGLFRELQRLHPHDLSARRELLKTHVVEAGDWVIANSHTVPFFDPDTKTYVRRSIRPTDQFTLYEWLDHMLSPSSNAAASVVWKEAVLMRAFGPRYPVSPEEEATFFATIPRDSLGQIGFDVVHTPLAEAGISADMLRIGSLFTYTASRRIPVGGGSYGTPEGLLAFLIRLEQGRLVDPWSSLELKRLLYLTDRRIRFASAPTLAEAAVYFKSGSLYKCKAEEGFACGKYRGNVYNYMNSVAIVEPPDGRIYLVALMSNVLKQNSAVEHQTLATLIERLDARIHAEAVASKTTESERE